MKIQSTIVVTILTLVSALVGAAPEIGNPPDSKTSKDGEIATAKAIDVKHLIQHWVHSREEQKNPNAEEQIYRPAKSRKFPPSRFRKAFKFSEGGDCEWMFLDPADRHHFKPGKWEINPGDNSVLKITGDGKTNSFRIVELSKDILRLVPAKAKPQPDKVE